MCSTSGMGNRAIVDVTPSRTFIAFRFTPRTFILLTYHRSTIAWQSHSSLNSSRDRASDSSHRFHLYFLREEAEEGLRFVVLMLLPVMSSMRMTCFGNLIGRWPSCPKQVEKFLRLLRKMSCPSGLICSVVPPCHSQAPGASWFSREE